MSTVPDPHETYEPDGKQQYEWKYLTHIDEILWLTANIFEFTNPENKILDRLERERDEIAAWLDAR